MQNNTLLQNRLAQITNQLKSLDQTLGIEDKQKIKLCPEKRGYKQYDSNNKYYSIENGNGNMELL